ncbi:hypothetical protein QEN19_002585 [Hanseniaspora menglaensis]
MPNTYLDNIDFTNHHDDLSLDNDNNINHNETNNDRYYDSASLDNHSNYTSYEPNNFFNSTSGTKNTILPLHRPINKLEKFLNLYDNSRYNNYIKDFNGRLVRENGTKDDGYFRSSSLSFIEIYVPKLDFVREILYIIGNIEEMMILTDLNESSESENLVNNKYFKDIKQFDDLIQHKVSKLNEILEYHAEETVQFLPPANELMDDESIIEYQNTDRNSQTNSNIDFERTQEPVTLEDGTLETEEAFLARKAGSALLNEYPINIPTSQDINSFIGIVNESYERVVNMHDSYVSMKNNLLKFQEERCIYFEVIKYLNRKTERVRQELQERHIQSTRLTSTLHDNGTFGRFTDDVENSTSQNPFDDDFEIVDEEYTADTIAQNIQINEENEVLPMQETLQDNVLTQYGGYLVYGSIFKTKILTLEKLCNRATRGNLLFYHAELPTLGITAKKMVSDLKECFVIYTHGNNLKKKIEKIIDSLDGKLMSRDNSQESLNNINGNIQNIENILVLTENQLFVELIALQDQIPKWNAVLKKEFNVLKMLATIDNTANGSYDYNLSSSVIIKGWIPQDRQLVFENYLKFKFRSIHPDLPMSYLTVAEIPILENYPLIPTYLNNNVLTNKQKKLIPPTHFNSYKNPFTSAFQGIVDAYGTSKYKEINPAVPTIITFPFMFSIMFGDIGHGLILFIISLVLVLNSHKIYKHTIENEILAMAYNGRFILLLMGVFSVYIGLLYNDIFGKTLTFFKSGWEWLDLNEEGATVSATKVPGYSYPFGLDYGWHNTENGLLFTNSYKMKLSIIMGFTHMLYSLFFSLNNYIYYQSYVDIMGNFIPGLVFMCCIFGYLTICIVLKWSINWTDPSNPREAPSLLNMLINMFLKPGYIEAPLFKGQTYLQLVLLAVSLLCIPWLLMFKPYYLYKENLISKSKGFKSSEHEIQDLLRIKQEQESSYSNEDLVITSVNVDQFEEFELGDLIIHQIIHTIEFCLNCISHTASYLRLWALSLAHQQLSSVLWEMTLQNALSVNAGYNPGGFKEVLGLMILFGMWFVLTCAILVAMEGTSAMLHALRLHWVEAMSKHFIGEGIPFEAFKLSS